MQIVPFEAKHLTMVVPQPMQVICMPHFTIEMGEYIEQATESLTGIAEDGGIVGMAGLMQRHEGCAIAWAVLSEDAGQRFIRIHKIVSRVLKASGYHRIEAYADAEHGESARWLELLGFKREGLMQQFSPDRRDHYLYARVK